VGFNDMPPQMMDLIEIMFNMLYEAGFLKQAPDSIEYVGHECVDVWFGYDRRSVKFRARIDGLPSLVSLSGNQAEVLADLAEAAKFAWENAGRGDLDCS